MSRLPISPVNFALSYYARYPAISPIAYPPVFYLMEGACYRIFGASPFVAKGLVLVFTLLGCFYLMAWLRRWISHMAGWAALLFLLQPAVIIWSTAVMLNIPGAVLGVAALYHWRRWLENPATGQLYWSVSYALLAAFTYSPMVVVALVMFAWVLIERKFVVFKSWRLWVVTGVAAALLLPWMKLGSTWDPGYRQVVIFMGDQPYWKFASWFYYLKQIPSIMTLPIVILALFSLLVSLRIRQWRAEVQLGLVWFVVCYGWFSIFSEKEQRYILLLIPPLIILGAVGLIGVVQICSRLSVERNNRMVVVGLLVLLVGHFMAAHRISVPRVSGFREVVSYVRELAPDTWVFYDGRYQNLFAFWYRLEDPNFGSGVVRASKLLYAVKLDVKFGYVMNATSIEETANLLQHHCGCKYFVVERQLADDIPPERFLRNVLSGKEFRLVRSFRVETPNVTDLDLYEYMGELLVPQEYDLRFPDVSDNTTFRVKPIPSIKK